MFPEVSRTQKFEVGWQRWGLPGTERRGWAGSVVRWWKGRSRTSSDPGLGNVNSCNLPAHKETQLRFTCLKIGPLTAGLLSPRFKALSKICERCTFGNHSFLSVFPV